MSETDATRNTFGHNITLTQGTPWEGDSTLQCLNPSALRKEVYILRRTGALANAQAEELHNTVKRQRIEISRLRGQLNNEDGKRIRNLVERALKECEALSGVNETLERRVREWRQRAWKAEKDLERLRGKKVTNEMAGRSKGKGDIVGRVGNEKKRKKDGRIFGSAKTRIRGVRKDLEDLFHAQSGAERTLEQNENDPGVSHRGLVAMREQSKWPSSQSQVKRQILQLRQGLEQMYDEQRNVFGFANNSQCSNLSA